MSIKSRNILGKSLDNGLPSASAVDGADNRLGARRPYIAPLSVTDQTSASTEAERGALETAFIEAKDKASLFNGSGAEGVALSGEVR